MRIVSFNINGSKAICGKLKNGEKKGHYSNNCLKTLIKETKADILCLQEIKTQDPVNDLGTLLEVHAGVKKPITLAPYYKYIYHNLAEKKGYSGTAIFCNVKPEWVEYDFKHFSEDTIGSYSDFAFTKEGRMITAKFETFVLVNCYVPNTKSDLSRLEERLEWEQLLRNYVTALELETELPVIICGDLNVAHKEIDIHSPKTNKKSAGFTQEERDAFSEFLKIGFVDAFRTMRPMEIKYSYWSNFRNSRENNKGWRLDYFLISESAKDKIIDSDILTEFMGSDHCPVYLEIDI